MDEWIEAYKSGHKDKDFTALTQRFKKAFRRAQAYPTEGVLQAFTDVEVEVKLALAEAKRKLESAGLPTRRPHRQLQNAMVQSWAG